jgi:hypothetical protein
MCDYGVGSCPIRRGTGHNSAVSPGRIGAGNRFAALAMEVGRPRYGAKGVGNTYPSPHHDFSLPLGWAGFVFRVIVSCLAPRIPPHASDRDFYVMA